MPITGYPFSILGAGNIPKPLLPISITNPYTGQSLFQWALIDTGADICAVPAWIAIALGHDLKAGATSSIGTGNGHSDAYRHTMNIEIFKISHAGTQDPNTVVHRIPDTPITCMQNLSVVLLGVNGFLQNFKLTIDYPRSNFSINYQK